MGAARPPAGPVTLVGFSLLELLIALAVIVVIAAIGVPLYRGHVDIAQASVLTSQMAAMAVFQEDTRLRTGTYGSGTFNSATGVNTLATAIGWQPAAGHDTTYVVAANGATSWTVTATDSTGFSLCRVFPANAVCAP